MMVSWMAYAALCAALFGLAAACVDRIFAAWKRARRGVWISAIAASSLIPLVVPLISRSERAAPVEQTAAASDAGTAGQATSRSSNSSTNIDVIALTVWGTASLLFTVLLLVAHRRTTIALRGCGRGTIGGRPAFISKDFGPAVVGLLRPEIVVPSWALALDEAEQQLVVTHELEHARSGDPLLALAGLCAVVAMPWNIALWWQLSRLRLAIELDCDARVVARRQSDALAYTRLLLSVGERVRGAQHAVLAMSRSRSALAKRFDALLGHDIVQPRKAAGLLLLAAGTMASVAFVPAPRVSEIVSLFRPDRATTTAATVIVSGPSRAGSVQREIVATPVAATQATAPITKRSPRPATSARSGRAAPPIDVAALPPISVVPAAATGGHFDSVVVAKAVARPTIRPVGGVLTASPTGAFGRGGFSAARASGGAGGAGGAVLARPDSNALITRATGGRAGMVARPDTTRPPR